MNKWVVDANLPAKLYGYGYETGNGILLPNGKVLFLGGTGTNALYTPWTTNYSGVYTPNGADQCRHLDAGGPDAQLQRTG